MDLKPRPQVWGPLVWDPRTLLSLGFKVAKNQTQLATLQTMQKVKFRTILMIH